MISFDKTVCTNLAEATAREWLETNGIGGFASATLCGMNRRRYHALLTAATKPPVGRMVLLSKLEETLIVDGTRYDLSTNQYDGAVHPRGFEAIASFRLDPFPITNFRVGEVELEKSVFMVDGRNATVVQYALVSAPKKTSITLELRPLIAFRDYHGTTHENDAIEKGFEQSDGKVILHPYRGVPDLYLSHNAEAVRSEGFWYRNFIYQTERERGLDDREDLFNPLVLTFALARKSPATVIAATEDIVASDAAKFRKSELARRKQIAASGPSEDLLAAQLTLAADQFLARRGENWTVLAGYPWFTDWGRDTMIALPGLTLFTGRTDIARGILLSFAESVSEGMLPNRFPDQGETAEYNTVDASLWFFEAVRAYLAATGDIALVRDRLFPVLSDILDWHIRGTRYGIRMLDNGLLNAGEPGVQLTWMDAKIGDWVVTPRSGKPVEIQALWFNALKIMEELARDLGKPEEQKRYRNIAALTQHTFNRVFWNDKTGCLYDVVNGGAPDASIRPNQVFAVSLPHSMLMPERARAVVEVVEQELLTPYGLRSLSPKDPKYRPRYEGNAFERDSAYHQGTVWPWLLGPFISAYIKVNGGTKAAREQGRVWLQPLASYMADQGVGQVPEVFDGSAPHRAGGCFAQAWSVAELLRALCMDINLSEFASARANRPAAKSGQAAAS